MAAASLGASTEDEDEATMDCQLDTVLCALWAETGAVGALEAMILAEDDIVRAAAGDVIVLAPVLMREGRFHALALMLSRGRRVAGRERGFERGEERVQGRQREREEEALDIWAALSCGDKEEAAADTGAAVPPAGGGRASAAAAAATAAATLLTSARHAEIDAIAAAVDGLIAVSTYAPPAAPAATAAAAAAAADVAGVCLVSRHAPWILAESVAAGLAVLTTPRALASVPLSGALALLHPHGQMVAARYLAARRGSCALPAPTPSTRNPFSDGRNRPPPSLWVVSFDRVPPFGWFVRPGTPLWVVSFDRIPPFGWFRSIGYPPLGGATRPGYTV